MTGAEPPRPWGSIWSMIWSKNKSLVYRLHPRQIPERSARFTYTFGLGGITLLSALIAALTGVLLMFYYVPSREGAHASVVLIDSVVSMGRFTRAMHYWSAQVMVVSVVLHASRVVFTGGYRPPREFNWLVGLGLLVVTLLWDFSGYVLRHDSASIWALTIGVNLLRELPVVGDALYIIVVGGQEPTSDTVLRFYTWHVAGLTLLGVGGILYHAWRVRADGGISFPGRTPDGHREYTPRETLLYRELVAALVLISGLVLLSVFVPPSLGTCADLNCPGIDRVRAPWFFTPIQRLLRYLPPLWGGWAIPLGALVLLAALPLFDRHGPGRGRWFARERWKVQVVFGVLAVAVVVLGVIEWVAAI